MTGRQEQTPYLDALCEYARRRPARLHVPGHKGGAGADLGMLEAFGEGALSMDIPALTYGVDVGIEPTPFEQAQRLAAEAWGAKRAWFLINGASQGNLAAGLALAHRGSEVVVQRNAHSSTIDALVLSGLRPTFAVPEVDQELGIAHCLTEETLERALAVTPGAVGAWVVSPTYFGAVANVRALAAVAHAHGVPLIVDEAWGAHMAFHEDLPEHALAAGADLVISSTHKIVGSLTQSAMLHLGHGAGTMIGEDTVDRAVTLTESTSPNSLLAGSLDAARRQAAVHGRELLANTMAALVLARAEIQAIDGLDVLDDRLTGRPGVFAYDPLRLAVDVRGVGASGYELAPMLREIGDINLELYGQNVLVAVFGMGERRLPEAARLVAALRTAVERVGLDVSGTQASFASPPPWGELAMTPREAYLGATGGATGSAGGRADRGGVAGDVPAGDSKRAPGRALDGRDAGLRAEHARAGRQRAGCQRPAAAHCARCPRGLSR